MKISTVRTLCDRCQSEDVQETESEGNWIRYQCRQCGYVWWECDCEREFD